MDAAGRGGPAPLSRARPRPFTRRPFPTATEPTDAADVEVAAALASVVGGGEGRGAGQVAARDAGVGGQARGVGAATDARPPAARAPPPPPPKRPSSRRRPSTSRPRSGAPAAGRAVARVGSERADAAGDAQARAPGGAAAARPLVLLGLGSAAALALLADPSLVRPPRGAAGGPAAAARAAARLGAGLGSRPRRHERRPLGDQRAHAPRSAPASRRPPALTRSRHSAS